MSELDRIKKEISANQLKLIELQEQLDLEKNSLRKGAIVQAKHIIQEFDLTAIDLGFSSKKSVPEKKRAKVEPRYRDPLTGETWSGRGRTPNWLAAHISAGRNKEGFRI